MGGQRGLEGGRTRRWGGVRSCLSLPCEDFTQLSGKRPGVGGQLPGCPDEVVRSQTLGWEEPTQVP